MLVSSRSILSFVGREVGWTRISPCTLLSVFPMRRNRRRRNRNPVLNKWCISRLRIQIALFSFTSYWEPLVFLPWPFCQFPWKLLLKWHFHVLKVSCRIGWFGTSFSISCPKRDCLLSWIRPISSFSVVAFWGDGWGWVGSWTGIPSSMLLLCGQVTGIICVVVMSLIQEVFWFSWFGSIFFFLGILFGP